MTTEIKYENGVLTVTRIFDAPREEVFDAVARLPGRVIEPVACA